MNSREMATGKQAEKKRLGKTYSPTQVGDAKDFCSVVEGVTFGIRDGRSFALMSKDWTPENRIEWAQANAQFFQDIVDRIENWGRMVAKETGLEYPQ